MMAKKNPYLEIPKRPNVCLHCGGTGIRTMPDHSNSWQTRRTLDADRQRDNRSTGIAFQRSGRRSSGQGD